MSDKPILEYNSIEPLLRLLDDPDQEVYDTVLARIVDIGSDIIPYLQDYKDTHPDILVVQRANSIIHTIRLSSNFNQWKSWKENKGTALEAIQLIGEILDTDYNHKTFINDYARLKKSLWLDINLYMTPLEVFHSVSSIIYSQYNFKVIDSQQVINKKHFHPNLIFDNKSINQYLFALILTTIMDEIDTNIKAIKLPYQLLLAFFELKNPFKIADKQQLVYRLSAYLDPKTAEVFSENDIEMFFKKIDLDIKSEYFVPLSYYQLTFLTIYDLYKMLDNTSDEVLSQHLLKVINEVFEANLKT